MPHFSMVHLMAQAAPAKPGAAAAESKGVPSTSIKGPYFDTLLKDHLQTGDAARQVLWPLATCRVRVSIFGVAAACGVCGRRSIRHHCYCISTAGYEHKSPCRVLGGRSCAPLLRCRRNAWQRPCSEHSWAQALASLGGQQHHVHGWSCALRAATTGLRSGWYCGPGSGGRRSHGGGVTILASQCIYPM